MGDSHSYYHLPRATPLPQTGASMQVIRWPGGCHKSEPAVEAPSWSAMMCVVAATDGSLIAPISQLARS
jgi:hypothetical protein